jgi:glycosyltransferase involved in cell wall biosynthesis
LNPSAGERAGISHYTYHLVKSLLALDRTDDFVLFFDARAQGVAREFLKPNTKIVFFTFSQYKKYLPFVYSHVLAASKIASQNLDIYHSPANVIPLRYAGKFCITTHDLAIYRRPDLFPKNQGFALKYIVPRTIHRAKKIIAVSEFTKREIQEFFPVDEKKIRVIYEGADHQRFFKALPDENSREYLKTKYKIRNEYLLFVGTLEPRKNLIRLLEAFYKMLSNNSGYKSKYQLLLAGTKGWLYDSIFDEVKNRGLEHNVLFPGYIDAKDLPLLYKNAKFFVYPSLYEGFGLPVLEAMACGVPVITSNASSLPEIVGDAALLVDQLDVDGLTGAMQRFLEDEKFRTGYSEKALLQAKKFSWEKCAKETLEVYKEAATL